MSTRFSQWRNTEYVGLPVESYLQAGLIKDQRIDTELQKTSAALGEYKSLQALGANAEAYQNEIMSGIKTQLEELAKGNLKSPEALMKMQSIVTNPTYVNGLKQIAKSTEYFKAAQKAAKDYEKESGNQINAAPFYEAYQQLMNEEGNASKFNPNLFANMDSFPKYMEIQKELNETVKNIKENKRYFDASKGAYIKVGSIEEITPERIRETVNYEFKNRKDILSQFNRNLKYDAFSSGRSLSEYGDEIKQSYANQASSYQKEYDDYQKDPTGYIKKQGKDVKYKPQYDAEMNNIKSTIERLNKLAAADSETVARQRYIDNAAEEAVGIFGYKKETMDIKTDGSVLQARAFARQDAKEAALRKMVEGGTAIVPTGLMFAPDAKEVEAEINNGNYLIKLLESSGVDRKEYEKYKAVEILNKRASLPFAQRAKFTAENYGAIINAESAIKQVPITQNKKLVEKIAVSYGYNPKVNVGVDPAEYLKTVHRNGNSQGVGIINKDVDAKELAMSISSAGAAVYENGVLVKQKDELLNGINGANAADKAFNLVSSQLPLFEYSRDGKPVASFRHPTKENTKISYELTGELARGMQAVAPIMRVVNDMNYGRSGPVKPLVIEVPEAMTTTGRTANVSYTGARLPVGSPGLTFFKNADSQLSRNYGERAIYQVAAVLNGNKSIDKLPANERLQKMNEAIKIINSGYLENMVSDGAKQGTNIVKIPTSNGISYLDLKESMYIIDNQFTNPDQIYNMQVGLPNEIKKPSGKGFVTIGGMRNEVDALTPLLRAAGQTFAAKSSQKALAEAMIQTPEYTYGMQY